MRTVQDPEKRLQAWELDAVGFSLNTISKKLSCSWRTARDYHDDLLDADEDFLEGMGASKKVLALWRRLTSTQAPTEEEPSEEDYLRRLMEQANWSLRVRRMTERAISQPAMQLNTTREKEQRQVEIQKKIQEALGPYVSFPLMERYFLTIMAAEMLDRGEAMKLITRLFRNHAHPEDLNFTLKLERIVYFQEHR